MQEILVKKATFPLRKGETLDMFMRQLRDEVFRQWDVPGKRENDWADEVYVYTKAVLPGQVIFKREGKGARSQGIDGLWASDFTRDEKTHKFNFAQPVRVVEEKMFTPIQKSNDFEKVQLPDMWEGTPIR